MLRRRSSLAALANQPARAFMPRLSGSAGAPPGMYEQIENQVELPAEPPPPAGGQYQQHVEPSAGQVIDKPAPLSPRIVQARETGASIEANARALAARVLPAAGDSLATLRGKAADFHGQAANLRQAQTMHTANMEALAGEWRQADAQLESMANRAIQLTADAIAAGDAAGARAAQEQAEQITATRRELLTLWEGAIGAAKGAGAGIQQAAAAGAQLANALDAVGDSGVADAVRDGVRAFVEAAGKVVAAVGTGLALVAVAAVAVAVAMASRPKRRRG